MSIFQKIKPVVLDQFSCKKEVTIEREKKKAELMDKFRSAVAAVSSSHSHKNKVNHHEW